MEYLSLISDYENLLLGQIDKMPKIHFVQTNKSKNEKNLIYLYKYLIEDVFKWTPNEAKDMLNWNIIKIFKLKELTQKYFPFLPGMVKSEKCKYIVHKCYPDKVFYDAYISTIHTYENVLSKNEKWQKKYFSVVNSEEGYVRACICLNYILSKYYNSYSVSDLYYLFSKTSEINKILSKYKLKKACDDLYYHPIDFLHCSLQEENRDDFLYYYYKFADMYKSFFTKNQKEEILS